MFISVLFTTLANEISELNIDSSDSYFIIFKMLFKSQQLILSEINEVTSKTL